MSKQAKELAKQLRNVGPKLAERLVEVGIDTPENLRKLGAQAAFLKMYEDGDAYGDFNAAYIFALEGAIQNCDWLEISDEIKASHKKFAQQLQTKKKRR